MLSDEALRGVSPSPAGGSEGTGAPGPKANRDAPGSPWLFQPQRTQQRIFSGWSRKPGLGNLIPSAFSLSGRVWSYAPAPFHPQLLHTSSEKGLFSLSPCVCVCVREKPGGADPEY